MKKRRMGRRGQINPAESIPTESSSKKKIIIYIVAILIVLVVAGISLAFIFMKGGEKISSTQENIGEEEEAPIGDEGFDTGTAPTLSSCTSTGECIELYGAGYVCIGGQCKPGGGSSDSSGGGSSGGNSGGGTDGTTYALGESGDNFPGFGLFDYFQSSP